MTLLIAAFALLRALEGALVDDVRASDRAKQVVFDQHADPVEYRW